MPVSLYLKLASHYDGMLMNLLLHDATIVTCEEEIVRKGALIIEDERTNSHGMENRRLQTLNIERVMRTAEKAKGHLVDKLAANVK